MGHIRHFHRGDIPQVAHLHRTVFQVGDAAGADAYHAYLQDVFLDHPAAEAPLSLVYEDGGRVSGFLGLVPRRVVVGGQRFRAVVSSQFVVEPQGPVGLVALRLAKAYLEGPQDLSIADEANEVSRRIWEGLGGRTASLLSLYWTRPLRPARLALSLLRGRRNLGPLAVAARPVAAVVDALAARLPASPLRQVPPPAAAEELRAPAANAHAQALHAADAMRVDYDDRTFQWLLDRVAALNSNDRVLQALLRRGERVIGWYVCRLDRGGVAHVLQLTASPAAVGDVLDHLFHAAWRAGAAAVSGRLDPRFLQALSDRHCLFHRRGPWVMVKTSRPELLQSFQAGSACLSPLDGEWPLRFLAPA
jgi:hypothetical protein